MASLRDQNRKRVRRLGLWRQWVKEYYDKANPRSAEEIAARYHNPVTGKNYTAQNIYKVLRKFNAGEFSIEDETAELLTPASA